MFQPVTDNMVGEVNSLDQSFSELSFPPYQRLG